ncbi:GNAT family protein [Carnobacterium sp.]|uniref:GNAT family N-acetyltransferase n=1 Tax=Carnobacterium sp. TaxID=48221 RepID=UPI0028A8E8E5|nr:GNAT family protein [Carnobacterium sp.]
MKNYFYLPIDSKLSLVQPTVDMATILFDLVDSDREHIREFLDFVDTTKEPSDEIKYINMKLSGHIKGTDRLFLISYEDELVGSIDLHFIDSRNKKAEIGYWIHSSQAKKGITTKCVKKVCQIAFEEMGLNKLSIVADTENAGSNAVALKSGFSFVGTDKEDIVMYDKLRDMNKYSLLKSEFKS